MSDASTSTPTTGMLDGQLVNNAYILQQQTPTSPQAKHMFHLHDTSSDEYHTANEDSFNITANNSMNNSITQQAINTANNVTQPATGGNITPTSSSSGPTTMAARKQMVPLDQSEPAKPLSAYALFFRDTVSAIKQQNPTCSFQELSKIVASMWDALDPVHKNVYNKKNELAKTEYIKQMRIYQQQQQQQQLNANAADSTTIQQQQQQTVTAATNVIVNQQQTQQNIQIVNTNNNSQVTNANATTTSTPNTAAGATPSSIQNNSIAEAGSLQKCTRENCNKRAIINPDWEDEYCSNECVIIHCRNVFNAWVQSNIEAKRQQQQQEAQQQASAT